MTRLELPGYNIFRSDHPCNNKRGGVCIYYKLTLRLKTLNILNPDKRDFEVNITNKICSFILLYRFPSPKQDGFRAFESRNES